MKSCAKLIFNFLSFGWIIDWKWAWWDEAFIERMEWKRLLLNGTRSLHREPLFRPHPFRPYPNPWWGLLSLFPDSNRNIHRPFDWKSRWKGDYRLFMNSSIQMVAVKSSLLVKSSFQPQIIESNRYNTAIFWPNQWPWFINFLESTQKMLINRL